MTAHLRDIDKTRDIPRCAEIWWEASAAGHPFLTEAERSADLALVRADDLPAAESIVAERDGQIVGYISLWGTFIGALFVDPACHGQGIGRQLVEAAAARKGRLAVEVYADNRRAIAFFRKGGFVKLRRRPTDGEGRPHALIRMERPAPG